MNTKTFIFSVCSLLVLTISSCRKDKPQKHLYQVYKVVYDQTDRSTYAVAYFGIEDSTGKIVKFGDPNTIQVNGISSNSHLYYLSYHGSDTYEWIFEDIINVAFELRLPDKVLTNAVAASSVGTIALSADSVLYRTDSFTASWSGTPLQPDEKLIVSMSRNDTTTANEGVSTHVSCSVKGNMIEFYHPDIAELKPGRYRLAIEKRRTLPLQQNAGTASGKFFVILKAYKFINVI